jgi:OOP family OmpA-OmpF porin
MKPPVMPSKAKHQMVFPRLLSFILHLPKLIGTIFVLLCFYSFSISSQNLIENGGFDSHTRCPNRISQIALTSGWFSNASPDLFCTCTPSRSSVYAGLSFVGSLLPHSGDCYSGFIVNARYKEYLTYELPEKIRGRRTYCIRFVYARSAFTGIKVDSLGIYLHKKMYKNATRGQPMYQKTTGIRIADRPGIWTAVSVTFTCRGGERFLTIGSFGDDLKKVKYLPTTKNRKNIRIFNYSRSAYYFIDDVELILLPRGETCETPALAPDTAAATPPVVDLPAEQADTVNFVKPFVLQELHFETAKSEILPSSFEELDELADHLISQPELNLLVMGHTDNRGNEKTNLKLSESRAHAVADYLVSKGITRGRLAWQGFGSTKPVVDNVTEEGRRRNRRVELQFN